jgi:hypothetical protein
MVLWDLFAKQDYHVLHHYLFFVLIQLAETKDYSTYKNWLKTLKNMLYRLPLTLLE